MRKLLPLAALAAALLVTPARAEVWSVYGINGNDTGGIIPWSPQNERDSFAIASEQCARWNKIPIATSIRRQYGDYIGYKCVWERPVAAVRHHRRRVDVMIDK